MTDEEKKAIQRTNNDRRIVYGKDVIVNNKNLEIILNLIQKQEKVIDEMAKAWKQDDIRSIEEIKQYFYRKVENE